MSNHTYMFRVYGKYTNTINFTDISIKTFKSFNLLDTSPITEHLKMSSLS